MGAICLTFQCTQTAWCLQMIASSSLYYVLGDTLTVILENCAGKQWLCVVKPLGTLSLERLKLLLEIVHDISLA